MFHELRFKTDTNFCSITMLTVSTPDSNLLHGWGNGELRVRCTCRNTDVKYNVRWFITRLMKQKDNYLTYGYIDQHKLPVPLSLAMEPLNRQRVLLSLHLLQSVARKWRSWRQRKLRRIKRWSIRSRDLSTLSRKVVASMLGMISYSHLILSACAGWFRVI